MTEVETTRGGGLAPIWYRIDFPLWWLLVPTIPRTK